jgi:hypothetical protein
MIIVNPAPGAWLAKVRYPSGISSKQRYAIVADAILKVPALALTTPGQQFNVAPNQEFTIPITVANYGGHIAAGVTAEISGPSSFGGDINKSRYLGNLLSEDDSVSPQFKIRAPATPDIYYLQAKADGINKDFDNSSYPVTGQVKVYVGVPGQVTYPSASGITWSRGSAYTIRWTGFGAIQGVRIELYKGGILNSVISDSAPNAARSFTWTVPAGQALGSDYKVRVTSASNFAVFDTSDYSFTIFGSSYLQVDAITPSEGTMGTEVSLTGSGFETSTGKIYIGAAKTKILQWNAAAVEWLMSKPPLPGVYELTIAPKMPKGVAPTVLPAYFTVKGPEIASLSKNSGFAGEQITISGNFFGTKKGKVLLTDGSGKPFKCKVLSWVMDPKTNAGSVVFAVPKKVYGVCDVTVVNKIGSVAVTDAFTVQQL